MRTRHAGFTLIEVMIVVAIVAILAAIAVPQYGDYVRRGKIAEATSTLADMRVKLEQYFKDNGTYAGACAAGTTAPIPTIKYFTITCPTLSLTAFTVQAAGKAAEGIGGFTYTVDQNNARTSTITGVSGWNSSTTCWITKKAETC